MLPGLLKDEKKIASLIVQGPEKKVTEEKEISPGLSASAEELLAAIKTSDKEGIVSALKSFMDLCYQEKESMEEEGESEKSYIEE